MFSVTSGYLNFPGQKTHRYLASASQRFFLCVIAPAFISQFIHLICVTQGIFSAMIYFGFVLFSLWGAHPSWPPPQQQWWQTAFLSSLDCNHSKLQWSEYRDDVSKHKGPWWQAYTRGLGCLLIGWSCQNKFVFLAPKFKFQPGEPRRKSCFTSKAPRISHSLAPI